jgi:hypothetical protein
MFLHGELLDQKAQGCKEGTDLYDSPYSHKLGNCCLLGRWPVVRGDAKLIHRTAQGLAVSGFASQLQKMKGIQTRNLKLNYNKGIQNVQSTMRLPHPRSEDP